MIILIIFLLMIIALFIYSRFKVPPFSSGLTIIYGKKGSGKSVYLAKIAKKYSKRPNNVYSNVPISECYVLPDDFYDKKYPPGSVILLDEGGIVFNSRNFKAFPKKAIIWFKLQRHLGVRVFMTSQAPDVDLIIRNLADNIYISKRIGSITYLTEYIRSIVVVRAKEGKTSDIAEDYHPRGPFGILLSLNFLYYKMFDSWCVPEWMQPIEEKTWADEKINVYDVK